MISRFWNMTQIIAQCSEVGWKSISPDYTVNQHVGWKSGES